MASNKKSQEEKNGKKNPIEAAARAKSSSRKPSAKQNKEKEAPAAAATAGAKSSGKRTPTKQQGERSQKNTNASSSSDSGAEEQKVIEISYTSGDFEDGDECEQRDNVVNGSKKNSKSNNKGDKKRKGKSIGEDDGDDEDDCDGADAEGVSMFKFPMARIKRIMQCGDIHSKISQDAVFLVNKATEKFLEKFCEESYGCMVRDRRKAIDYKQLSAVVGKRRRFDFLSDFVPVKIKASDALEERKQAAETAQG